MAHAAAAAAALKFRVTPAGLLEWCGLNDETPPDLSVQLDAANPACAVRAHAGRRAAAAATWPAMPRWPPTFNGWSTTCAGTSRPISSGCSARSWRVSWRASGSSLAPGCAAWRARRGCARSGQAEFARPQPRGRRLAPHARCARELVGMAWVVMRRLARLVFIAFTLLRFGVDEVALSGFRQRWVRGAGAGGHPRPPLRRAARRAAAPGARAAGPDLREVRAGAVDPPRPAAARCGRRAGQAAGPRAAVSRASRPRRWSSARSAPRSTCCSPASTPQPVASASIAQVHFAVLERESAASGRRRCCVLACWRRSRATCTCCTRWPAGSSGCGSSPSG